MGAEEGDAADEGACLVLDDILVPAGVVVDGQRVQRQEGKDVDVEEGREGRVEGDGRDLLAGDCRDWRCPERSSCESAWTVTMECTGRPYMVRRAMIARSQT